MCLQVPGHYTDTEKSGPGVVPYAAKGGSVKEHVPRADEGTRAHLALGSAGGQAVVPLDSSTT